MQLLFPDFLWGLLAVCVPLLIHLLQLRRPQRVRFTNTGFIQQIEFKTGRRRLKDLLVLALRILAVAFLVLAFCQPFISARRTENDGGRQQIQVFVDNSFSMSRPGESLDNLRGEAINAALAIEKSYGLDARLQLLGHTSQAATSAAYKAAAIGLPQTQKQMGWGASVVQRNMRASDGGALYVISDFQKDELQSGKLKQLSTSRPLILVPQVSRAVGNIYVDSVWINDSFVRARENIGLHIRLRNGGSEVVSNCPVKVLVGGQQAAIYQTTLTPGQALETVVQVQVRNEQITRCEVVTADAPVAFDNHYYFTLQPTAAVQVVEIGPAALAREAYRHESLFRYSDAQAQHVDFGKLQQANLVLLSEPAQLDAGLRSALVAVVRRGGSVVIVPTALPQAHESYGQLLQAFGIGGVQWENAGASKPVQQEVALPNLKSPFFRDVFGAQPRQVVLPSASPVLRLTGGGTDVLRLRDGEGYLTEFTSGAGRVYVFAAPFDSKYSDFTTHALFVPVLYRLAMLSYRNDQPLAYRVGEQTLTLRVPRANAAETERAAYRLVRDSLQLVPAQRWQGQQLHLGVPVELSKPGFYELRQQGQAVATLAFNATKSESELAAYSAAELRQLGGPGHPNVRVLDSGQPLAVQQYRAEQTDRPLWRYCLLLALACLLVEGVVLRWGRNTGAAALASR